jgi:hypothetical protein
LEGKRIAEGKRMAKELNIGLRKTKLKKELYT